LLAEDALHTTSFRAPSSSRKFEPAWTAQPLDVEAFARGAHMSAGHLSRETGDKTDQESRSAGYGAATNMTVMGITIHASFLPHNEPDTSLALDRDTLGFEVRNDVGYGGMRWITAGPVDQPVRRSRLRIL
jgi:hypothetical protein